MSPRKRAADKVALGFYIPVELKFQLEKKAAAAGVDMTSLLVAILTAYTRDVVLTETDYREIADRVERKRRK